MLENPRPLKVAVIVGSVREGRFGAVVSRWFAAQTAGRTDMTVDVVDLADVPLPLVLPAYGGTPSPETVRALAGLSPRLDTADAFVVITPEYNHSFPASLKNVIDWHQREWHAKPVGFVSYGGLSGGLRAIEQLRIVFAEVHAVTIRDTVSFHNAWGGFDPENPATGPAGCESAAKTMLDQLAWWAHALRDAKTGRPYAA
ncbi:NAD(P)H-dependent oxidoreductase [Microtetraspora sp. NBRC 13810]|uniref:NADPH-dependent FMN reductase n=1 Tax=Microtetraspora sp. NBRC 13810 TaxID=3030990 RepID=UPI0025521932|nr:NAD(P)H-dependent oxidoreductase [Microtetraspora sp. NBRC 13810]